MKKLYKWLVIIVLGTVVSYLYFVRTMSLLDNDVDHLSQGMTVSQADGLGFLAMIPLLIIFITTPLIGIGFCAFMLFVIEAKKQMETKKKTLGK